MKFLLISIFTFSLIASSAQAASLDCEGAGGLVAQFRINARSLTVLYYGSSSFGDFRMVEKSSHTLTYANETRHNNDNGIPLIIRVPRFLSTAKRGTKANVSVIATPYNTSAGVTCTVSQPGR